MRSLMPFYQSLRFRIVALSLVGLLLVTVALSVLHVSDRRNNNFLYEQAHADRQATFDESVSLHSQLLQSYVHEYAQRDDMLRLVRTKDAQFAKQTLLPSLPVHQVTAVWVYDATGAQVYSANTMGAQAAAMVVPGTEAGVGSIFRSSTTTTFYVRNTLGVLEVHGMPLYGRPGEVTQSNQPHGYLLAGRLLTSTYLAELSKSFRGDVELLRPDDAKARTSYDVTDGRIAVTRQLKDQQGQTVGVYFSSFNVDSLRHFYNARSQMSWLTVGVYVATSVGYIVLLIRWILLPLNQIHRVLQNREKEALLNLVASDGEFGQIARLIAHFFDQQSDLMNEVTVQRQAQVKLEEQATNFERINSLMVGRELRMAELKRRNRELEAKLEELRHG